MYLSITQKGVASVQECESIRVRGSEDRLIIECVVQRGRGIDSVYYEVDKKEDVGVYLMNDRGQTIDTIFRS
jgi:hypothetical protein